MDITYVPMARGFVYLAAVIDWFSRKVLSWRLLIALPRRNAKPWKTGTPGATARNGARRASKYLDRALWRRVTDYHRRSRAETKMNCVKLLDQKLMARDFGRQVAELQVRVDILNCYTALGIPVTQPAE